MSRPPDFIPVHPYSADCMGCGAAWASRDFHGWPMFAACSPKTGGPSGTLGRAPHHTEVRRRKRYISVCVSSRTEQERELVRCFTEPAVSIRETCSSTFYLAPPIFVEKEIPWLRSECMGEFFLLVVPSCEVDLCCDL